MIVGRIIGWVLIAAALVMAGAALVESLEAGAYQGLALGEIWYKLHPSSLNIAQAVIQRYIHPTIWDPVLITVLLWPGWLVAGVPGVVLAVAFRRRERGKRRFASDRGVLSRLLRRRR